MHGHMNVKFYDYVYSRIGIRSPNLLSRSKSLYRLSYAGPLYDRITGDNEMHKFERQSFQGNSYTVQSEQLTVIM